MSAGCAADETANAKLRDDLVRMSAELTRLRAAVHDAAEAMARIRLVHDNATGARTAWRIAREWQETH